MTFSRRRVLAAVAGAGSAGAFVAAGTRANLTDTEGFEPMLTAGIVDLVVEYDVLTGPGSSEEFASGIVDGQRIDIPVGQLTADEPMGSVALTFALPQGGPAPNNPAALWLALDCPTPGATALGEVLQVTLSTVDCQTADRIDTIASGSVRAVADQLRNGVRIDGDPTTDVVDCLTDETCLLVEYELVGYVGTETVDVPLWFAAVQCRHDAQANPFAGRTSESCEVGELCPCCRTLGKLEFDADGQPGLDDSYAEPGTYAFTEGDTSYGLEIYETAEKDGGTETTGVAFRLVRMDDTNAVVPRLCTVYVKAGTGYETYDRDGETLADTATMPGGDDAGILYAPDGRGISHVTVCICTTESEADCPGCTDPSLHAGGNRTRRLVTVDSEVTQ